MLKIPHTYNVVHVYQIGLRQDQLRFSDLRPKSPHTQTDKGSYRVIAHYADNVIVYSVKSRVLFGQVEHNWYLVNHAMLPHSN